MAAPWENKGAAKKTFLVTCKVILDCVLVSFQYLENTWLRLWEKTSIAPGYEMD